MGLYSHSISPTSTVREKGEKRHGSKGGEMKKEELGEKLVDSKGKK